ncbi:MAG: hypothetical protein ACI4FX_03195 [Agathobacter sp.]
MKKYLFIVLSALLLLCGCGNAASNNVSESEVKTLTVRYMDGDEVKTEVFSVTDARIRQCAGCLMQEYHIAGDDDIVLVSAERNGVLVFYDKENTPILISSEFSMALE